MESQCFPSPRRAFNATREARRVEQQHHDEDGQLAAGLRSQRERLQPRGAPWQVGKILCMNQPIRMSTCPSLSLPSACCCCRCCLWPRQSSSCSVSGECRRRCATGAHKRPPRPSPDSVFPDGRSLEDAAATMKLKHLIEKQQQKKQKTRQWLENTT